MNIVVQADGRRRTFQHDQLISVGQFLELVSVDLGELDRVSPPETTQISDGLTITVVRVEQQTECEETTLPFQQRRVTSEGLAPGEERLAQAGVNGVEEVCYRITVDDGQPQDRVEISRLVIQEPQEQIIFVGVDTADLETVPVEGTLLYLSNQDIWMIRNSSASKRPLTTQGGLDGKVFTLSQDGNQVLYTQTYTGEEDDDLYFNTLWALMDTRASEPEPVELSLLNNILYAEWVPNEPYTFGYSAAEARDAAPGWQAFNDFWLMQIEPDSGQLLSPRNIIEASSGGVYGWWGTQFRWSPDGSMLAWSRADSVGLVDLDTGDLTPLLNFPLYTTFQDWVWQPTLSWSPDGLMLITTMHGPPFGSEEPESSPIFNIAVTDTASTFQAEIVELAGIWANPEFSPFTETGSEFPQAMIAYLKARSPLNSRTSAYDLVVADRDGSNARVLFPETGQAGLEAQQVAWSPSGRQIAFIYEGNLWIIDVDSGLAQQLTIDGNASLPQWGP